MVVVMIIVFTQVRNLATPVPVAAPVDTAPIVEEVIYNDVLVATTEVPFGTRLTQSHLKWVPWPQDLISNGFISNQTRPQAITELVGSVTRSVIYEGEPISERKLVMSGDQGLMATLLKPGMRAVTTRISVDTAAGGFIQPGDSVDIILTTSTSSNGVSGSSQTYRAKTIFEDVRVLAIDQTFSTDENSGATVIGSTATFELSQKDSELLQESVAQGDLTLTLRSLGPAGAAAAKSHASVQRDDEEEKSSLVIYRQGQASQVAIGGQ